MAKREITDSLMEKVAEGIDRTIHLASLVPASSMSWQPPVPVGARPAFDFGHLFGHLLDCLAGFCAVFQKALSLTRKYFSSSSARFVAWKAASTVPVALPESVPHWS